MLNGETASVVTIGQRAEERAFEFRYPAIAAAFTAVLSPRES